MEIVALDSLIEPTKNFVGQLNREWVEFKSYVVYEVIEIDREGQINIEINLDSLLNLEDV